MVRHHCPAVIMTFMIIPMWPGEARYEWIAVKCGNRWRELHNSGAGAVRQCNTTTTALLHCFPE